MKIDELYVELSEKEAKLAESKYIFLIIFLVKTLQALKDNLLKLLADESNQSEYEEKIFDLE